MNGGVVELGVGGRGRGAGDGGVIEAARRVAEGIGATEWTGE